MAEIIEQRVEKTSFGDIGKNIGDVFLLFMEVLAGDGEKCDAVGCGGDGAEGARRGFCLDGEKHGDVIPQDMDGHFI